MFVGGSVAGLLITDEAAGEPRSTLDVDVIAEITSYAAYASFGERLRDPEVSVTRLMPALGPAGGASPAGSRTVACTKPIARPSASRTATRREARGLGLLDATVEGRFDVDDFHGVVAFGIGVEFLVAAVEAKKPSSS